MYGLWMSGAWHQEAGWVKAGKDTIKYKNFNEIVELVEMLNKRFPMYNFEGKEINE